MPSRRDSPKVIAAVPPRRRAAVGPAPTDTPTQRIVESITSAIIERRLMPGTKLAEQKLADIFNCSRTLVRQALNQLSRDQLVTLHPSRGAFVATPSVDEARQVFEARQMIEGAMVRHLCTQLSDAQIDELRAHLEAEHAAIRRTDIAGRTRLLADFHVVLARMMGNDVLAQLLTDLLTRSSLIALMYQSTHSAEASYVEHVAIVDALARRDARAAARLTHEHLASVERNLRLHPRTPDLAQALQAT
ncbi:MAG: GntR family transcriptional regulator [Burkholderiaceae bacterium]|nr:GntR family transcriptional regulator [Burkholderiaceae bacterium]